MLPPTVVKRSARSSFLGVIAVCLAAGAASAQTPPTARVAPPTRGTAPEPRSLDAILGTSESPALSSLREAERAADQAADTVADAARRDGATLDEASLPPELAGRLQMPALPFRMTSRMVRELALFRTDSRARRLAQRWTVLAGRYRTRLQQSLAAEGMPTALLWVAAAESAFDPRAESSAGAAGLWQFMPDTARSFGLRVDSWVDERRDPEHSTRAAVRYLRDLHSRLGSWELAFAAYNMGYTNLLRSIRKYNTNDFDTLATLEAGLPWETTHYVPRILSLAVAAQNPGVFEITTVPPEAPVTWEDVEVQRSLPLSAIAREAQVSESTLRELNPALLRNRTPPPSAQTPFVLHVPQGRGAAVRTGIARIETPATRAYVLRHGETLDEVAARFGTRTAQLLSLSGLSNDRGVGPGTMLLVPDRVPVTESAAAPREVAFDAALAAITPPEGARRVWLRVSSPDALAGVARALQVGADDLARWNNLDPHARVHSEMWLQAFVTRSPDDTARTYSEAEVALVDRASEGFHDRSVAAAGQVRLRVTAAADDTFASLAARYGTTPARLERINRRGQRDPLTPGETVVVYADPARATR